MNFNWQNWRRHTLSVDKAAEIIAGLGIPGLVLILFMSVSGWAGAAAITTALASLGGPFGMLGGIATLGVLSFIAGMLSKFGFKSLFKKVLTNLKEKGKTSEEILQKIEGYPISEELKLKLRECIKRETTDE